MAALAYGICYAIRELYLVTNAFFRCGYDIHKSLSYIRAKNRLRLFQKYCEAVWLQYEYESLVDYAAEDNNSNNIRCDSKNAQRLIRLRTKMNRRRMAGAEIDFAAIEATAMAREAAEGYLMTADDETDSDSSRRRRDSLEHDLEFEALEIPEDIEIVSGVEADISYYDHIDSHPQCRVNNLGVLKEGVCFIVTGRILLTCERFSINFLIENPSRDVALHINPRLPQNYIVRNTRVRNVWGREEIATNLHFNLNRGKDFVIHVLFTEKCFMISTNGMHTADYAHRLPYRTIKAIEVKGDVEKVQIRREIVTKYPERQPHTTRNIRESLLSSKFNVLPDGTIAKQVFYETMKSEVVRNDSSISVLSRYDGKLPMPYVGKFDKQKLENGHAISFEGRIKLLPHSFYINLQDGVNVWPHQNIAFHFNPRFSSHGGAFLGRAIVCRNAWFNGHWAKEQRSELDTNLMPGKKFNLIILCTNDSFKVYINGMFVTSFKYQISPTTVTNVYVRGDVHLTDVSLLVPTLSERSKSKIIDSNINLDDISMSNIISNAGDGIDTNKIMNITNNPSYDRIDSKEYINPENSDDSDQKPNSIESSSREYELKFKEERSSDNENDKAASQNSSSYDRIGKSSTLDEQTSEKTIADEKVKANGNEKAPQNPSYNQIEINTVIPSTSEFESALEDQPSEETISDDKDKSKGSDNRNRRGKPN